MLGNPYTWNNKTTGLLSRTWMKFGVRNEGGWFINQSTKGGPIDVTVVELQKNHDVRITMYTQSLILKIIADVPVSAHPYSGCPCDLQQPICFVTCIITHSLPYKVWYDLVSNYIHGKAITYVISYYMYITKQCLSFYGHSHYYCSFNRHCQQASLYSLDASPCMSC